jgi:poly-gamma-glutamate synthesis protein (capsule biosynthesis protein)
MRNDDSHSPQTTLLAVGDVMLCAGSSFERQRQETCLRSLRGGLGSHADLVFANLETTLHGEEGSIAKEPRLQTHRDHMASALTALGVNVVSLANNHAFDSYLSGFRSVTEVLRENGVAHFGAGAVSAEAAEPLVTAANGLRIGWLGYVARDTDPSHVASPRSCGVRLLDTMTAKREVSDLGARVDAVVVSLHWGVEYCHVPAPEQMQTARSLIDAGATLVLGHHAHVIQGIERHGHGLIAYGLGNAVTTDLSIGARLAIKQSRRTNSALALRVTLARGSVPDFEAVPYRIEGDRAFLRDRYATRVFSRATAQLATNSPQKWRRRRILEDVVLRPLWKLDPRVIRSLNWGHARKLARNLFRAAAPASVENSDRV